MSTKEKVKCAKSFIETLSKIGKTKLKKKNSTLHDIGFGNDFFDVKTKVCNKSKNKMDYIK